MAKKNVTPPFFRTAYNYDAQAESIRTGLKCLDESKAIQSAKDSTDINVLVEKFGVTGHLPVTAKQPMYGDFVDAPDLREALETMRRGQAAFDNLEPRVRKRFASAADFMDFMGDPENLPDMIRLGLAKERPKPPPEAPEGDEEPSSDVPDEQGKLDLP